MLHLIVTILGIYLVCVILAAVLYIPKYAQLFGAHKKIEKKTATKKRKIALVIPARNESKTIGSLFDSIAQQDYDAEFFDINVIVQEKDDPTVKMAKERGANVFVVPEQHCKGEALDGYFRSLSQEKLDSYDAFVIIDADAVLTPDYVSELNNALEYDRDIFVTKKHIKNYLGGRKAQSLTCDCSALVYSFIDECGNIYRTHKNVPLNLCGQGMMVRRKVIETIGGWPYRSLTEDYELKMASYLHGFTSMYYPYAVIYTEEVTGHRESYIRRSRWLAGYSQCDKRYKEEIARKIEKEHGSLALRFEFLYYKAAPALYLAATFLSIASGIVLSIFGMITGSVAWVFALYLLVLFPMLFTYLIAFVYGAIGMVNYRDVFKSISVLRRIRLLFLSPFFTMEFVPIYVRSRRHLDEDNWKQPERIVLPID